jgi:hypothetical protein
MVRDDSDVTRNVMGEKAQAGKVSVSNLWFLGNRVVMN